jgi:hypothetical protein
MKIPLFHIIENFNFFTWMKLKQMILDENLRKIVCMLIGDGNKRFNDLNHSNDRDKFDHHSFFIVV